MARKVRASLTALGEGKRLSLITLTVPHNDRESLEQVRGRLLTAWRALRKEPVWKAGVRGGASIEELKWNGGGGGWHPHFHVVADADFVRKEWLAETWGRLTGGTGSRIEAVRTTRGIGHYLAGYVTKQIHSSVYSDPGRLIEAMGVLKGARMVNTFGDWRGVELEGEEEEFDASEWRPLARLADVLALADEGAPHALRILARLRGEGEPPGVEDTAEGSAG